MKNMTVKKIEKEKKFKVWFDESRNLKTSIYYTKIEYDHKKKKWLCKIEDGRFCYFHGDEEIAEIL